MFEFQEDGISWLSSSSQGLLGDEPGLGKTRQLLLAADGATLVVAPAMLVGVWEDELAKWRPNLDLTIVPYSQICQWEPGPKGGRVAKPIPHKELKRQWDTLIFDEAHYLKSRGKDAAAWARAGQKLKGDRIWLATGTPIPNWAPEIWSLLRILHPKERFYDSYWRWAGHWFNVWNPPYGGTKVGKLLPKWTWDDWHEENLGGVYLARTWDELEDQLPPLRRQTIEVSMTPAQKTAYRALKKDFVASLPDGQQAIAWNSGSLEMKLVMASTGLEVLGSKIGSSGKFDMARELLRSWEGHPAVVACQFRRTAELAGEMCRRIGREAIVVDGDTPPSKRFEAVKRFQSGEADILVCTIESICEGLTITRADRMLFLEKSYRPSRNQQLERRIWRIGQENPCLVVDLVTKDTVDVRIRTVLGKKTDQQMKALRRSEFAKLA